MVVINEEEIQKLAVDATVASQQGKITKSLAATAPKHIIQRQADSSGKMSKNKKKKLKKKIKRQLEKHQQELYGPQDTEEESRTEEACTEDMDTNAASNERVDEQMDTSVAMKTVPQNTQSEMSDNSREQPVALPPESDSSDAHTDFMHDVRMMSVDRDASEETQDKCKQNNESRSREEERKGFSPPVESAADIEQVNVGNSSQRDKDFAAVVPADPDCARASFTEDGVLKADVGFTEAVPADIDVVKNSPEHLQGESKQQASEEENRTPTPYQNGGESAYCV